MALALTEPVRLAGPRASTQAAASTTNAIANSKAIADSQAPKQSVVDARPAIEWNFIRPAMLRSDSAFAACSAMPCKPAIGRLSASPSMDGRSERPPWSLNPACPVRRFDRALSSLGIRTERDPQGELSFSVPESAWAAVRNTLSIKGEGRRFPTGQFSQLKLTPEPPTIRPQDWSADDLRTTLRQVFNAQASVRQSYQRVTDALREAGDRLQQRRSDLTEASRNAAFSQSFESAAGSSDSQSLSAILPALLRLDRDRVMSVLRLT
jgi:hypothetical protein